MNNKEKLYLVKVANVKALLALLGGGLGGGVGALIGSGPDNNTRNSTIGGLAGASIGGLTGYGVGALEEYIRKKDEELRAEEELEDEDYFNVELIQEKKPKPI